MREFTIPSEGGDDTSAVPEKNVRSFNRGVNRAFREAEKEAQLWKKLNTPERLYEKRLDIVMHPTRPAVLETVQGLDYLVGQQELKCLKVLEEDPDLDAKIDAVVQHRAFLYGAHIGMRVLDEPYEFPPFGGRYDESLAFVYEQWRSSAPFDDRCKDLQLFLYGQNAGNVAHELFDVEDDSTIIGEYVRMWGIPWSDIIYDHSEDVECVSFNEPEVREAALEGVMCTLFAVREHQTQTQMADSVYKNDLAAGKTAADRLREAANTALLRFYTR